MSTQTWTRVHHRYDLINRIIADPDALTEAMDGAAAPRRMPAEVLAEFGGRDGVLRALHQRWVTILEGMLDAEMESGSHDGAEDLRHAYRRAVGHSPDLFAALQHLCDDPTVAQLTEREHLRLASSIGLLRPGGQVTEAIEQVAAITSEAAAGATRIIPRQRSWRELLPEMLFRRTAQRFEG